MTPHPFAPLRGRPQWIIVRLDPLPSGKTDKLPINYRTGNVTPKGSDGAHNPDIWLDHATAAATAAAWGPRFTIGFVLTAGDPFFCVDVDDALQPDGQWPQAVHDLCAALPGCAIELSQSGRGLHLWGQGVVPAHCGGTSPCHRPARQRPSTQSAGLLLSGRRPAAT